MSLFDTIWNLAGFVEDIASFLYGVITAIYGIISTIWLIISDFMTLFPPPIQALIITAVLIASGYYVYHWIKDIEIAGFKI